MASAAPALPGHLEVEQPILSRQNSDRSVVPSQPVTTPGNLAVHVEQRYISPLKDQGNGTTGKPHHKEELPEIRLLGLGNPLLNLEFHVIDEFWEKYDLEGGTSKSAMPFTLDELEEFTKKGDLIVGNVAKTLGGPMMYTLQSLRKLIDPEECLAIVGCVGNDPNGKLFTELCEAEGIIPLVSLSSEKPTGVVINIKHRKAWCQFINRGASKDYTIDHLRFQIWNLVERCHAVYTTAGFVLNNPIAVTNLAQHCVREGKTFFFDLTAPFILRYFTDQVKDILPFVHYLFCNREEILTAKKIIVGEDIWDDTGNFTVEEAAIKLVEFPVADPQIKRTVIVTDGYNPITVAKEWSGYGIKIEKYPVKPLKNAYKPKRSMIAGDSFVAGFIAAFLSDFTLEDCIKEGTRIAQHNVQRAYDQERQELERLEKEEEAAANFGLHFGN